MIWTHKPVNILLVDNDEAHFVLLRRLLEEIEGVQVELDWEKSYQGGLNATARNDHDACLIDYRLGGKFTGIDLIKAAVNQGCPAPLILLTGHGDRNLDLQAMQAGAADFLPKEDLSPALLERSIRYAIERKRSERQLQQGHDELEERITKRTAQLTQTNATLQEKIIELEQLKLRAQISLEWRTRQVQTSTQVAQEISVATELDALFKRVVNLIQERFGYYHTHVYTLNNDFLIMREGTGDAGQMMKQVGHKIPAKATRSLVAKAARNKEAVLVADVSRDKRWLPNLLLAETKSELAVPIKLGTQVLGVLDIQHDAVGGLSLEDQLLMMGLCGQIAVAIYNQQLEIDRKQALDDQQKLIEELDAFGHTVGHNLKEPLGLIIGYTALLKEQARLPEALQSYLNAIARNGQKLNNIIEELQLLTGVRKETVDLKPLNMIRIVAEVQQRLAYLVEEYNAKIIVSEYWPVALGHTPWIEEVWTNYISNAIKHGGDPPVVHVGATAQSDGMVRFWVRDNGPGISPEQQARLFTEFTQLDQTNPKGYGLGLSIAQRIVTKLGGQVGLTSDGIPGQGCIFTFTLPGIHKKQM